MTADSSSTCPCYSLPTFLYVFVPHLLPSRLVLHLSFNESGPTTSGELISTPRPAAITLAKGPSTCTRAPSSDCSKKRAAFDGHCPPLCPATRRRLSDSAAKFSTNKAAQRAGLSGSRGTGSIQEPASALPPAGRATAGCRQQRRYWFCPSPLRLCKRTVCRCKRPTSCQRGYNFSTKVCRLVRVFSNICSAVFPVT